MNGRHLLDTNIIIALFKNDRSVRNQIAQSAEVFVPSIAIGELYFGALHSAHPESNVGRIQQFAAGSSVLPCDLTTAEFYGQIRNELKSKGRPVPENDIWIAAVAIQHSLTAVSRDQHFAEFDGLLWEQW